MVINGNITYNLWTITGNRKIQVSYRIDDQSGKGSFEIQGRGDAPDLNEDELEDILMACVEDSKRQPQQDSKPEGMGKYDFSMN